MTAYELRSYPGGAAETTLASDVTNAALSIPAVSAAGYSDGTGGPAFIIVDYDNSKAEKIRYTSLAGNSFIVPASGGRGQDGSSAVAHSAGAKIRAVWTATDAAEGNKAAHYTVGLVTTKGDLLAGTAANALGRVAAGADNTLLVADAAQSAGVKWSASLLGISLDAASTHGGISGTTLAAERAAWTTYTPTFTAVTSPTGEFYYKQVGKTLYLRLSLTGGTFAAGSTVSFTLPNGLLAAGSSSLIRQLIFGISQSQVGYLEASGGSNVVGNGPAAFTGTAGSLASLILNGVIEVQ